MSPQNHIFGSLAILVPGNVQLYESGGPPVSVPQKVLVNATGEPLTISNGSLVITLEPERRTIVATVEATSVDCFGKIFIQIPIVVPPILSTSRRSQVLRYAFETAIPDSSGGNEDAVGTEPFEITI